MTGPIAPASSVSLSPAMTSFPVTGSILIYAVVDPDNAIAECNDANNMDAADQKLSCAVVQ